MQVFFYSKSIFVDAKITPEYIPYAVIGTNAVNMLMTFVAVHLVTLFRFLGYRSLLLKNCAR